MIAIEEIEKKWFLGQKDFKLKKLKESDEKYKPHRTVDKGEEFS